MWLGDLIERQTLPSESTVDGLVLLLVVGGVGGYVVRLSLRAEAATDIAARKEAAIAERERIARGIHDSVLQVLALVSSRGKALGGEAAELGALAAEQEAALRSLVSGDSTEPDAETGLMDVRGLIEPLADAAITVSCPATAVMLPPVAARALSGAALAAIDNVRKHAGSGAHGWVLVEDDGAAIRVSVRDDGAGFGPGRLAAAAAAAGSASRTRSSAGCATWAAPPPSRPGPARERRWTCVSPTPADPVRVLVVDDHPIWRDAAARSLAEAGYVVTGTARDGAQALRVAAATRPDVVLLDLNLPDFSGAEVTRQLLAAMPGIRVLMLSASGERQDVLDAVTAGASGYLLKSAEARELIDAVQATAGRQRGVHARAWPAWCWASTAGSRSQKAHRPAAARTADQPAAPELTERETEILRLVATGLTYPQIAARLTLSPRTVQNHVQNTLSKLQLHNKAQLVRYALERGVE